MLLGSLMVGSPNRESEKPRVWGYGNIDGIPKLKAADWQTTAMGADVGFGFWSDPLVSFVVVMIP